MSHYRYLPPKLSSQSNSDEQWASYLEYGDYVACEFKLVPLRRIPYDRWSDFRFHQVLTALRRGKVLPPVALSWSGTSYSITDGNHRCAASVEMGYDQVPAVVCQTVKGEPSGIPGPDVRRKMLEKSLFEFLLVLRSVLVGTPDISVQGGRVGANRYTVQVIIDRGRYDDQGLLTVDVKGTQPTLSYRLDNTLWSKRGDDLRLLAAVFGKWLVATYSR